MESAQTHQFVSISCLQTRLGFDTEAKKRPQSQLTIRLLPETRWMLLQHRLLLYNQSGVVQLVSTGSTFTASSDFVTDLDQLIFVAGTVGTSDVRTLYEFNPSYTTIKSLLTFNGGSVYGIAASDDATYALATSQLQASQVTTGLLVLCQI